MNRKQLEELQEQLPKPITLYEYWTKEQRHIQEIISCVKMINSCIAYDEDFLTSTYAETFNKSLGKEKVLELYKEQVEYFRNCIVKKNAYVDSEGVSYNKLIEN